MNNHRTDWERFDTTGLVELRKGMVDSQLRPRGITDVRVLKAMGTIPRHIFVSENLRERAYDDCPQSIGHGQTISQPFIVADMTQQLELRPTDKVLEIGTGCGYQTAVLAAIAEKVVSIERIPQLSQQAAVTLEQLGFENISLNVGDGALGLMERAPYDAIIVTAAASQEPERLFVQLAGGGRIIYPFGRQFGMVQDLIKVCNTKSGLKREILYPVRFVPLK